MSAAVLTVPGLVRRCARLLLLPLTVLVVVGAVLPQMAPPSGTGLDKLVHAAAFATLGVGMVVGAASRRQTMVGFVLLVLLAVAMEGVQSFVPGRIASMTDAAASVLGVVAGAGAALCLLHHQRILERCLRG